MTETMKERLEQTLLTADAVAFLSDLERAFRERRAQILDARAGVQEGLDRGLRPHFLDSTRAIRESDWVIAPVPADLEDRRVEITGPVDARMMINALNSGARVFMADFEDATTPTWLNLLEGQANLVDAYRRTLHHETAEKAYALADQVAVLFVRPRGWHLVEKHFLVDGHAMSASLFDFGLYLFHGGRAAIAAGTGPYLYLPKLESHMEARLWNDVFVWAQDRLDIPQGTIRVTVLIETILAAFEMDEILHELRDHITGLNAGRWDYIFSMIKKFRDDPGFVLPDRAQVTMTVPFMRAYTELMVKTCHRRGAHAIGGMAAFIPNRRDPEVTETAIARVTADKAREAAAGCDGTWVAHPDLVPVAMQEFDSVLGDRPNQVGRARDDVTVSAADLLDLDFPGEVTDEGVRANISVGIRYLASWLSGVGAAGIDNLMEDVATAEISRSQIWQWIRHRVHTDGGNPVTGAMVKSIADEVEALLQSEGRFGDTAHLARQIFEEVAAGEEFVEFLTLPAYEHID
ncbi:MAG TPA: malate synthase A [Acidimicrobiia bacterium]